MSYLHTTIRVERYLVKLIQGDPLGRQLPHSLN